MYRPYLKMDSKVCNYTTLYWHIFVQYLSWRKNWIGSHSIQVFVFGKPYRTYRSKSFNIKWWHSQMFYSQNSVRKGGQSLDSFEPLRSMFVVYDNLYSKYLNQVIPPGTYRYPKATEWVNQVMPPETNPKLLISYWFGTISITANLPVYIEFYRYEFSGRDTVKTSRIVWVRLNELLVTRVLG